MKKVTTLALALLAWTVAGADFAREALIQNGVIETPQAGGAAIYYPVFQLDAAPELDGRADEPGWASLVEATGFNVLGTAAHTDKQTAFRIGWHDQTLYLAATCHEPDVALLADRLPDGGNLWDENSVELFIGPERFQHLLVNSLGSKVWVDGGARKWQAAAFKGDDFWSLEAAIPFAALGGTPNPDEVWRFNITRNTTVFRSGGHRYSTWSVLQKSFNEPPGFRSLKFISETLKTADAARLTEAFRVAAGTVEFGARRVDRNIEPVEIENTAVEIAIVSTIEDSSKAAKYRRVPLNVDAGAGARGKWPVTFGVPVPEGELFSASSTRIVDANGVEVPSQIVPTATWTKPAGRKDAASIRWLLVDFQPACLEEPTPAYFLEYGTDVKRMDSPPISVSETAQGITVNNGVLQLRFVRERNTLIESAMLDLDGDGDFSADEQILAPTPERASHFVTHDGTRFSTGHAVAGNVLEITDAGPMRVVIRQEGWFASDDGARMCKAIHRYYIHRDSPLVRLFTTWIITVDTDTVQFSDMGFSMPMTFGDGAPAQVDRRLLNAIDMSGERFGLLACVRDLSRQRPSALEAAGNSVVAHLFSSDGGGNLDFRLSALKSLWGDQTWDRFQANRRHYPPLEARPSNGLGFSKTHETLLYFHPPIVAEKRARLAAALNTPPTALASGKWNCESRALGDLHPYDTDRFPVVEEKLSAAFDEYLHVVSRLRPHYGYYDFGRGVPQQISKQREGDEPYWIYSGYRKNNDNSSYPHVIAPWLLYLRSGDRRYYDYAVAMSRHTRDIRFIHHAIDTPALTRKKGWGYRGPGAWAFDGWACRWTWGHLKFLLLDYYTTGDRRSLNVAKMIVDGWCDDGGDAGSGLSSGNVIWRGELACLYRATWDERYYRAFKAQEKNMIAEGVHANRIKWNAYALRESLAVPEVSDEFKEFAETYADKLFELGLLKPERSMVHDTTKNFPFLNQIGYRLGGNPMYCAFARGWLEERRQLRMSFTDYDGLARAADLAAYMWLAAQPAGEELAVPQLAVIRDPARSPVFFQHAGGGKTVFRAMFRNFIPPTFLTEKTFAPFAEIRVRRGDVDVTETVLSRKQLAGIDGWIYTIAVAEEMPAGTYAVDVRYTDKLKAYPWHPYIDLKWFYQPGYKWVVANPAGSLLNAIYLHPTDVWFRVPAKTDSFTIRTNNKNAVLKLRSSRGRNIKTETAVWRIDADTEDQDVTWHLTFHPDIRVPYLQIDGIPPFIALSEESLFVPDTQIEVPAEASTAPGPDENTGIGENLHLTADRKVTLPTGAITDDKAVREFFDARQGTVDFSVKLNFDAYSSLNCGLPITVGFAAGHQPGKEYGLIDFTFKNVIGLYDGRDTMDSAGRFGPDQYGVGPIALGDGKWHHVAVQWTWNDGYKWTDGSDENTGKVMFRAYLDGRPDLAGYVNWKHKYWPNAVAAPPPGGEWRLGGDGFDIMIDEFRVSDILRYGFHEEFTPPSKPYTMDEHTLALFHFDGDLRGTGRGGKVIDGAWRE